MFKAAKPCHGHVMFKMSTGVVRAAICSFLTDSDHLQHVDRSKMGKEQVRQFLQAITENDSCLSVFDTFASSLLKVLEKCLYSSISTEVSCRSKSVKREKLWTAFHSLDFVTSIKCGVIFLNMQEFHH